MESYQQVIITVGSIIIKSVIYDEQFLYYSVSPLRNLHNFMQMSPTLSVILCLIMSSNAMVTSSVISGAGRVTWSYNKSSWRRLLTFLIFELASPTICQGLSSRLRDSKRSMCSPICYKMHKQQQNINNNKRQTNKTTKIFTITTWKIIIFTFFCFSWCLERGVRGISTGSSLSFWDVGSKKSL